MSDVGAGQKVNPGWSRIYVRILREGEISPGDRVTMQDGVTHE